jgi:hypothetical protein
MTNVTLPGVPGGLRRPLRSQPRRLSGAPQRLSLESGL